MSQKIILSSDEEIDCPQCHNKFKLTLGIARHTIEKYEQDYEAVLKAREGELQQRLESDAEKKAQKKFTKQLDELKEQLSGSQEELLSTKTRIERIQKETRDKAAADYALEKKMLQEELEEKSKSLSELRALELSVRQEKAKLVEDRERLDLEMQQKFETEKKKVEKQVTDKIKGEFETEKQSLEQSIAEKNEKIKSMSAQELALRQEKAKLEEQRQELELDVQRRVDAEKKRIEESVRNSESEKFRLKEAEYQKKIEDAQKANDDMARKLEQGSQQLQGEVLELEIENLLRQAFPHDKIEPVKKGARGADVIQTVLTRLGQSCGKIVWEAKRAEKWSKAWIQKLKDDQQAAGAELAVIITTAMPNDSKEPFCMIDDVWVVSFSCVRPVAETLRLILLEGNKHRSLEANKNEKMEELYRYICSPQFIQKLRAIDNAFSEMKVALDSEKAAMIKIWKRREAQIARVTQNMMGMVGELQAIGQNSIPQLEEIGALPAPANEADDEGLLLTDNK